MSLRVGFIGVGAMGGAMAARVLHDGLDVTVFDISAEATGRLAERGAKVADSPRAVADACEMVSVVVLDDTQVRAVVAGENGILSSERASIDIAIHSTIHLPTLREVEAQARKAGHALLDAAVSGAVVGAEAGELAVMVGGDEAAFERCRPALETYGGLVKRVGPTGAGMQAKVARQLLQFVQIAGVYEGMRLADAAGVDIEAFSEIVMHSDKVSNLSSFFLSRKDIAPDDSNDAGRDWLQIARTQLPVVTKDLSAALELAADLGIRLPVSEIAQEQQPMVWGLAPGERV